MADVIKKLDFSDREQSLLIAAIAVKMASLQRAINANANDEELRAIYSRQASEYAVLQTRIKGMLK